MAGKLKPAKIFCDRMILQRRKPIRVWGTCEDGEKIVVRLQEVERETTGVQGKWSVELPPMEACEQTEMEIISKQEHIVIHEVAIGEVWIAAGQSNMEFHLRYDAERKSAKENKRIRMFDYPEVSYEEQLSERDYSDFGYWRECTQENLDYFTAVGYYFAMQLEKKYHVPIGIVGCNWGGTPACAWMDPEYLKGTEGEAWLQEYEESVKKLDLEKYEKEFAADPANYRGKPFENSFQEKMMFGMSEEEFATMFQSFIKEGMEMPVPVIGPRSEKRPGGLYETMVKKIAPYTARGVLWYQGETDDTHADIYDVVLERLITCWRTLWKEQLPFLIVQLAPFEYWSEEGRTLFPIIREKQEHVSEVVSDVWMASIMDVGMKKDIHPKQKRPVGERLALLAEGHVYEEEILCDPPACILAQKNGKKVILTFSNAGEGLYIKGDFLQEMELFIDEKKKNDYKVSIKKNQLELDMPEIEKEKKIEIRFAKKDYCEVNLFNSIGLPVKPFEQEIVS